MYSYAKIQFSCGKNRGFQSINKANFSYGKRMNLHATKPTDLAIYRVEVDNYSINLEL